MYSVLFLFYIGRLGLGDEDDYYTPQQVLLILEWVNAFEIYTPFVEDLDKESVFISIIFKYWAPQQMPAVTSIEVDVLKIAYRFKCKSVDRNCSLSLLSSVSNTAKLLFHQSPTRRSDYTVDQLCSHCAAGS